jgi:hypothetical protein
VEFPSWISFDKFSKMPILDTGFLIIIGERVMAKREFN